MFRIKVFVSGVDNITDKRNFEFFTSSEVRHTGKYIGYFTEGYSL